MRSNDYVGARWWRVDFHTHTPASEDYGNGPNQAALKLTSPQDWLLNFMRARIDAVVVTDHNTGAWINPLKKALESDDLRNHADFRPLTLFPGVELTANGGIHVLAVFDPSEDSEKTTRLLGACGNHGKLGDPASTCDKSAQEVVSQIFAAHGIPILAHVDDIRGAFHDLTGATRELLVERTQLYAYEQKDPTSILPSDVAGEVARWAQVVGSDSHHPPGVGTSRYPGSQWTWVKMESPSLDGLRLALLDGNGLSVQRFDAVSGNPNELPELWIESLTVKDARVMGRGAPLTTKFGPRLNTIIGGRGSGKSTLVEFIRVATGRSDELPQSLQTSFAAYFGAQKMKEGKGAYTQSTHLAVTLNSHGARFRLMVDSPTLEIKTYRHEPSGQWEQSIGSVHDRFPVRIYSQKQVYELAGDRAGLLRQIDQHPDVGFDEWKEQWDRLANEYLALRQRLREMQTRVAGRTKTQGALEDVNRKLKVFETMGHEQVLKEHNLRQAQYQAFIDAGAGLRTVAEQSKAYLNDLALPDVDLTILDAAKPEEAEAIQMLQRAQTSVAALKEAVTQRVLEFERYEASFRQEVKDSDFRKVTLGAQARYKTLTDELAQQGVANLNQYGALVQARQLHHRTLKEIDALPPQIQALEQEIEDKRQEISFWCDDITQRRRDFLALTVGDNPLVRMKISHCGRDPVSTEAQWREVLVKTTTMLNPWLGEDLRSEMIGEIFFDLPKDPVEADAYICQGIANLKREVDDLSRGLNPKNRKEWIRTYFKSLPPETLDRVRIWWPRDNLEIDFRTSSDKPTYRPIDQGSPGQKTAAVLAFLLSYGEEPMILDQPEDDLDNHLIYDLIVTQLRENKVRRQVIVVTHNPNIVVNGDSEYVIPMDYKRGQCVILDNPTPGSLQRRDIRDEVCRIMEGGQTAFEKRYRRIALDSRHV